MGTNGEFDWSALTKRLKALRQQVVCGEPLFEAYEQMMRCGELDKRFIKFIDRAEAALAQRHDAHCIGGSNRGSCSILRNHT